MDWVKSVFGESFYSLHTDGAIRTELQATGLAAVVRDRRGRICHLWSWRSGPMTCNEAEYVACILALERMLALGADELDVYLDSKVVVDQMQGRAAVRSNGLKDHHQRLRSLTLGFRRVNYYHVPRLRNRLADALANNAAEGLVEF